MSDVVQQIKWPVVVNGESNDLLMSEMPFEVRSGSDRLRFSRGKRAIDLLGSSMGLLFLLPFLALVALLIALESRGPVFFRQRRTGRDGQPFVIYKFRTMRVQENGPEVVQATRNDSRVTFSGRFLRRSSIDELPQLLNVLKGDMSLVGPRPHAVAHDEYYVQMVPNYFMRFCAKPGITGLAQISGFRGEVRDIDHMDARIVQDITYIERWSLSLDIRILLRTVLSAPFDRAAY